MIIEVLTGLLLIVTAVYVYLTHAAVAEAREARKQTLKPYVVADFWPRGPSYPVIRLTNAGMDVDLTFTMERRSAGADGDTEPFTFQFKWATMPVGANHQISAPDPPPGSGRSRLDVLLEDYGPLRVTGTCRDMLGREHMVDQTIDAAAWWSAIGSRHELSKPAPTGEVAQQLNQLLKELQKVEKHLRKHVR